MSSRHCSLLTFALILAAFHTSGCSRTKVVSVSRQKQASTPIGFDDAYFSAYSGHDLLVVRFDTGYRGDDMPTFPSLTTADGKECDRRGQFWNKGMGSTVEMWFDVPESETQFILKSDGKSFPIDTSKPR